MNSHYDENSRQCCGKPIQASRSTVSACATRDYLFHFAQVGVLAATPVQIWAQVKMPCLTTF